MYTCGDCGYADQLLWKMLVHQRNVHGITDAKEARNRRRNPAVSKRQT